MSVHAKLCFTGALCATPQKIEERNLWTVLFIYSVSTPPVGWRLTRKISITPDTLIIMDYRRQFFMCLSQLTADGVGHTNEGEVFEFFWRFSVLDFYCWERQGGVKLWHPNGRKKPEKHMVTFTLSCTFRARETLLREKRSLFLKRRVELIIDFRSLLLASGNCFWHYCGAEK